jgi:hypothetical protein
MTRVVIRQKGRRGGLSMALAKAQAEAACNGTPVVVVRPKRPRHQEDDEQVTVFEWARLMEPQYPMLALLHAIPNGGRRELLEATRFKRQGVKAGVPDLDLPVAGYDRISHESGHFYPDHQLYLGLRIEMKRRPVRGEDKPRVSPEQKWWLTELQKAGHCCCVCYGADEAIAALSCYLAGKPVPHQFTPHQGATP